MKSRLAMIILALLLPITSCATLGRLSPAHDNFEQGLALFNQGRFAASVPYFERATRQDPEFAEAYFYLGRAHVSQSNWRAAIQPLRTAFRLSPREAQQEVMNLLIDATFAAALNDFKLGGERTQPERFQDKEIL
jgi:tetratricopeptide (TPR) repeat protein